MSKLKPLGARILVQPVAQEKQTASGLIIPDSVQVEKPTRGTVIDIGPGTIDEPMIIGKGDVVMYGKHAGTEVQIDGQPYLLMKISDVYGIIED